MIVLPDLLIVVVVWLSLAVLWFFWWRGRRQRLRRVKVSLKANVKQVDGSFVALEDIERGALAVVEEAENNDRKEDL